MGDIEFLLEFVLAVAALTVPAVVGVRILAGDPSASTSRQRGVQEEDPQRWNVQLIDRRSEWTRAGDPEARRQRGQPLPLSG